jgi:hypothetical protein
MDHDYSMPHDVRYDDTDARHCPPNCPALRIEMPYECCEHCSHPMHPQMPQGGHPSPCYHCEMLWLAMCLAAQV